jgi:hypothetical protein
MTGFLFPVSRFLFSIFFTTPSMSSRAQSAAAGCGSWRPLPLDTAFGLLGVVGVL